MFRLANQLVASQEGPCFVEFVVNIGKEINMFMQVMNMKALLQNGSKMFLVLLCVPMLCVLKILNKIK